MCGPEPCYSHWFMLDLHCILADPGLGNSGVRMCVCVCVVGCYLHMQVS